MCQKCWYYTIATLKQKYFINSYFAVNETSDLTFIAFYTTFLK